MVARGLFCTVLSARYIPTNTTPPITSYVSLDLDAFGPVLKANLDGILSCSLCCVSAHAASLALVTQLYTGGTLSNTGLNKLQKIVGQGVATDQILAQALESVRGALR
jgi:hypothetical protein